MNEHRPRKGQRWRRKSDGREVVVQSRRKVRPMAHVRPGSDMCWSLVSWECAPSNGGVCHESDFVFDHEFVSGPDNNAAARSTPAAA
jgi:hypothetical protein